MFAVKVWERANKISCGIDIFYFTVTFQVVNFLKLSILLFIITLDLKKSYGNKRKFMEEQQPNHRIISSLILTLFDKLP